MSDLSRSQFLGASGEGHLFSIFFLNSLARFFFSSDYKPALFFFSEEKAKAFHFFFAYVPAFLSLPLDFLFLRSNLCF